MTNQYLEKVALNATKARALAHEAGVVVDHKTQWKWALRQLRDSRGEVKVGKERAEALSRLLGKPAAGPNNFLQAVRSEQRKLRDVDEVQISPTHDRIGETKTTRTYINSGEGWSQREGRPEIAPGEYTPLKDVFKGTYGGTQVAKYSSIAPRQPLKEYHEAVLGAADTNTFSPTRKALRNNNLATSIDTHVHPDVRNIRLMLSGEKLRNRIAETGLQPAYHDALFRTSGGAHRKASPSGAVSSRENDSLRIFHAGDMQAFATRRNNTPANILHGDYVGLHRVSAGAVPGRHLSLDKFRSAYLDVSPRKMREPNPYTAKLEEMKRGQ